MDAAVKRQAKKPVAKGPPRVVLKAKKWPPSVFEEVLRKVNKDHGIDGDAPGKLIFLISQYQKGKIDNQMVNNWRHRGSFPVKWMKVVSHVSGVSVDRLMHYHDEPYPDKEFDAENPT